MIMKTLLLAATVLALGFGVARAESHTEAMRDAMMSHGTSCGGDRATMKDTTMPKQTATYDSKAWQNPGYAGGGG
jgi:hypothetical protein